MPLASPTTSDPLNAKFAAMPRHPRSRSLGLIALVALVMAGCPSDHDQPSAQPIGPKAPFDAAALHSALGRIVRWHAQRDPGWVAALRPGLAAPGLARALDRLPCRPPREIETLYAWHDGTDPADAPFVWYHSFPSLDEAIRSYHRLVGSGLLRPDEFPVLEFEGEYYVVRCSRRAADTSSVWLVFHDPERVVNYVSFTAYMETAADWYESGATDPADLRRLRAIHQLRNPGAQFPYAVH